MEHFFKCERGKLYGFLLVLLFIFSTTSAQDYEQLRKEKLNRLDLSGLGKTLFLNVGITNQNEVDYFKNLANNKTLEPQHVSSEEWHNLYERLMDADLSPKGKQLLSLDRFIETDPAQLSKSNIVPIGVLDMESIYLTVNQMADNEAKKKTGQQADFSAYEKFKIVSAAVLQEDVYQADISFRISPELYFSNRMDTIRGIEIDFNDGLGYKSFPISEQLIPHHFEAEGEHQLRIRLKTGVTTYVFETKVNVRQLERIKPYKEFQITADKISKDSLDPDRKARTTLLGGNIRIILGCDQILDKAIIIAEGIDLGQDRFLDNLEADYRVHFNQFLVEGYDLVLLDYTDGRAAMQDNAQVLKALIQQINAMKIGSMESIVIGESMSGLVARWTLTEMERDGVDHHVRLMLCYDTPHQGANVPVGLTQLITEADPTLLTQVILKFFAKHWRDYYQAFNTPAARQLLLHWGGDLTGGVGSKHPDFDAFRTQLLALGNGGYPQKCRNIAVTHGSLNASDRRLFDRYNYGDRILRSWTPLGLQNTNIDLHTHQLSQNTNVLRFATWGIFSKTLGVSKFYNSSLNDDFLPGGRTRRSVPNKLFNKTDSLDFCFVPTFSAIDYQGPRDTQLEREMLNVIAVNAAIFNRQTPFAAIYGRADNINTPHVTVGNINWEGLGFSEGLLTFITACPALPTPPTPNISTFNVCYPFHEKRTTEDNTANVTVSLVAPSNGQYIHNWTVLPSEQHFTTTGDQITFLAEEPGSYQITCVRTYPNRRDLESTFTTTMMVQDCATDIAVPQNPGTDEDPTLPVSDGDVVASDIWEGDFLLTTATDSIAVFAHYTPIKEVLYASAANGTFVPRASLEESGMFEEFAALFPEYDPRVALPVVLKRFNAVAEGRNAVLTWESVSEVNSDHYEIERSANGKDWEQIGIVSTGDLEFQNEEYEFVDPFPTFRRVFYRLKMVDADSTFAYSRIQSLTFDDIQEITAFPNPLDSGHSLQLLVGDQEVRSVKIYNVLGKMVFESEKPDKELNVQELPVGMYMVKVRLSDGTETSRTFVKR